MKGVWRGSKVVGRVRGVECGGWRGNKVEGRVRVEWG